MKKKVGQELFAPILHLKKWKFKTLQFTQKHTYWIKEPGTEHKTAVLTPNPVIFPLDRNSSKSFCQWINQTNWSYFFIQNYPIFNCLHPYKFSILKNSFHLILTCICVYVILLGQTYRISESCSRSTYINKQRSIQIPPIN